MTTIKRFSDVFSAAEPFNQKGVYKTVVKPNGPGVVITPSGPRFRLNIDVYCSITYPRGKHRSLAVTANEEMVQYIIENMVYQSYDQIWFKVVVREDGSASVYAKYNEIVGSHKLADIDPSTIPLDI